MDEIAFHKPFVSGREIDYLRQAVASGQLAGDGPFSRRCEELLTQRLGAQRVLLTPSCTAALELAALLCRLEPGDEVLMPSYTFVSTALAVLRTGAQPVFVDVRDDTLNLDESLLEDALSPRTRLIVPVHYAGVAAEMDQINELAGRRGLSVLEDAAQALGGQYRGRAVGSLGRLAAFSFHATKNIGCGEGGALCVNDPDLVARAEILRDKGTNRRQFFRGEVDKYTWVDTGSSYLASDLCAAYLLAQLEQLDDVTRRRREVHEAYHQRLAPLQQQGRLRLPVIPEDCRSSYHMFYVLLPDEARRDGLLRHLKQRGIQAAFHFVPLHLAPRGRAFRTWPRQLVRTEELAGRLVRLPFHHELTESQLDRVVEAVGEYLEA
ncbi:MAG: dTDP-4-amino-4,6-dideoxygalactose transaminase [Pirellulaceae bacterium]|nr:dTDP-4-amino-4,6-dideoxygalactose transaminase [Pirellulaceae bacterium]